MFSLHIRLMDRETELPQVNHHSLQVDAPTYTTDVKAQPGGNHKAQTYWSTAWLLLGLISIHLSLQIKTKCPPFLIIFSSHIYQICLTLRYSAKGSTNLGVRHWTSLKAAMDSPVAWMMSALAITLLKNSWQHTSN